MATNTASKKDAIQSNYSNDYDKQQNIKQNKSIKYYTLYPGIDDGHLRTVGTVKYYIYEVDEIPCNLYSKLRGFDIRSISDLYCLFDHMILKLYKAKYFTDKVDNLKRYQLIDMARTEGKISSIYRKEFSRRKSKDKISVWGCFPAICKLLNKDLWNEYFKVPLTKQSLIAKLLDRLLDEEDYQELSSKAIDSFLSDLKKQIADSANTVYEFFKEMWDSFMEFFREKFTLIHSTFVTWTAEIKSAFVVAFAAVTNAFNSVGEYMDMWYTYLKEAIGSTKLYFTSDKLEYQNTSNFVPWLASLVGTFVEPKYKVLVSQSFKTIPDVMTGINKAYDWLMFRFTGNERYVYGDNLMEIFTYSEMVDRYTTGITNQRKASTDPNYYYQLINLRDKMKYLMMKADKEDYSKANATSMHMLKTSFYKLEKFIEIHARLPNEMLNGARKEPKSIMFMGLAGQGKSTLTNIVVEGFKQYHQFMTGEQVTEDNVYTPVDCSDYDDGMEKATIIRLPDFLQRTDINQRGLISEKFIKLVSNERYPCNMSEATMKGKYEANPALVIGNTNIEPNSQSKGIQSNVALYRRGLWCTVKKQKDVGLNNVKSWCDIQQASYEGWNVQVHVSKEAGFFTGVKFKEYCDNEGIKYTLQYHRIEMDAATFQQALFRWYEQIDTSPNLETDLPLIPGKADYMNDILNGISQQGNSSIFSKRNDYNVAVHDNMSKINLTGFDGVVDKTANALGFGRIEKQCWNDLNCFCDLSNMELMNSFLQHCLSIATELPNTVYSDGKYLSPYTKDQIKILIFVELIRPYIEDRMIALYIGSNEYKKNYLISCMSQMEFESTIFNAISGVIPDSDVKLVDLSFLDTVTYERDPKSIIERNLAKMQRLFQNDTQCLYYVTPPSMKKKAMVVGITILLTAGLITLGGLLYKGITAIMKNSGLKLQSDDDISDEEVEVPIANKVVAKMAYVAKDIKYQSGEADPLFTRQIINLKTSLNTATYMFVGYSPTCKLGKSFATKLRGLTFVVNSHCISEDMHSFHLKIIGSPIGTGTILVNRSNFSIIPCKQTDLSLITLKPGSSGVNLGKDLTSLLYSASELKDVYKDIYFYDSNLCSIRKLNGVLDRIDYFQNEEEDEEFHNVYLLPGHKTVKGDCGKLYFIHDGSRFRFIGIHTAKVGDGAAMVTPVVKEDFNFSMEFQCGPCTGCQLDQDCIDNIIPEEKAYKYPSAMFVGKSKIFYSANGAIEFERSPLHPYVSEIEDLKRPISRKGPETYQKAWERRSKNILPLMPEFEDIVNTYPTSLFQGFIYKHRALKDMSSLKTWEECAWGTDHTAPIKKDTAMGFFGQYYPGNPTRKEIMDSGVLPKDMISKLDRIDADLQKGIYTIPVMGLAAKSELLPYDKQYPRPFFVLGMVTELILSKYLKPGLRVIGLNPTFRAVLRYNPHGYSATFYQRILDRYPNKFGLDVKAMDCSIHPVFSYLFAIWWCEKVCAYSKDHPDYTPTFTLLSNITNYAFTSKGHVWLAGWGLPSGHLMTAVFNAFVIFVILRFSQMTLYPGQKYEDCLASLHLGDDVAGSVSLEHPMLNQITFYRIGATFGIQFTTGDKKEVECPYEKSVDFLSRTPKLFQGRYVQALKTSSITTMLHWKKKTTPEDEYCNQVMNVVLMESFYHGKKYFDKMRKMLVYAFSKLGSDVSIKTWRYFLNRWRLKYTGNFIPDDSAVFYQEYGFNIWNNDNLPDISGLIDYQ